MAMRVVHFSDLHGDIDDIRLPAADVYVCTGDMLPNFPTLLFEKGVEGDLRLDRWRPNDHVVDGGERERKPPGFAVDRLIEWEREERLQRAWSLEMYAGERRPTYGLGMLRRRFLSPGAPVVCVRGNHDFVPLAPLFDGGPVHEISDPEDTITIDGRKFGGCRGINVIEGEWSDELDEASFQETVVRIPEDLDILVTHSPPYGILDDYGSDSLGSQAVRSYVTRRLYHTGVRPLVAHLFGHVHEARGTRNLGGTVFSNAATSWQVLEL